MTTPTPGRRTGSGWGADTATALLLTVLEAFVLAVGLYVAMMAAWDAEGTGGSGSTVLTLLLGGLVVAALAIGVVSGRAFRRSAPVTGCVQALVCAAVLVGAAALAYQGRGELRPDPAAPSSPYDGTYGQCFSGGDHHECPAG
ncbi:DUF6234 family protein [Streptomyces sp. KS 21]|uniref:DUF6234 family protein n=1 Tax=Streptomyces sp. KS 21 TaxID=2485150 RepID=UPI001062996C|nr:DUF6234 family protein [Streptomyces sp. KS 21]TDU76502.1 hypothetical protein EDD91_3213 [Streptomyces sp. KS 21]